MKIFLFIKELLNKLFNKKDRLQVEQSFQYKCVDNQDAPYLSLNSTYQGFLTNDNKGIEVFDDSKILNIYSSSRFVRI